MMVASWPVIAQEKVFHVGVMDPAMKGKTHNSTSLEGNGLSVSRHPEEWRSIARLGDAPAWQLTRDGDCLFLDAHRVTPEQHVAIARWGAGLGMVQEATVFEAQWVEDGDSYSMTSLSEEYIQQECEELGPEHQLKIRQFAGWVATPLMDETIGFRVDLAMVEDLLMTLYAERALYRSHGIQGVWWEDRLDPFSLSAPRGVIHVAALRYWDAVNPQESASTIHRDETFSGKGQLRCALPEAPDAEPSSVVVKARVDKATGAVKVCGSPIRLGTQHPVSDCPSDWDPLTQPDPVSGQLLSDVTYEDDAGASFQVLLDHASVPVIKLTIGDADSDNYESPSESPLP